MTRLSALRPCAILAIALVAAACSGSSDDDDGPTRTTGGEIAVSIEEFFTSREAISETVDGRDKFELPDGGTLASTDEVPYSVTATEVVPTEDGIRAFTEWHTETEFDGPLFKLELAFEGAPPDYLIVSRPASEANARIFVSGYVDADTGDPDWSPVDGEYDSDAGTVTAAISIAAFQSLDGSVPQVRKLSAPFPANLQSTTHIAYIAVGIGGQSFQSEVELVVEEPTGPLERPRDAPPVQVFSQIAARLVHITHKPLDTLTVTSDFGPRPVPVQGASSNHRGVDYRAADRTNVYAAGDGTVTLARCQLNSVNCGRTATGGITGGFYVEITHGDGETTKYFHMTNPATVTVGDAVTAGQVIGLSDSTGGVAPHLHFEVLKNGVHVDPELIFNQQVTTTIAMAIDFRIQEDTQQEINLVLGSDISPGDFVVYDALVDLTGVAPGEHALQFIAIHPNRSLQVLTYVPLTIIGALSGVTGTWTLSRDITTNTSPGYTETDKQTTLATFSLVAVGEIVSKARATTRSWKPMATPLPPTAPSGASSHLSNGTCFTRASSTSIRTVVSTSTSLERRGSALTTCPR